MAGTAGAGRDQSIVEDVILLEVAQLDVDAQHVGGNFRTLAKDHRTLHGVFQFAHVARPAVMTNGLLGLGREVQVVTTDARALAGEEGVGDLVDVTAALAQGRQLQGDHVEAVIQVFAELPGLGQVLQVAVGRGDQAHVDFLRLYRTNPANLAFLQHAQQACLGFEREFTDFVEEQCATVGGFYQASTAGTGAGECPFFMAEQFRFDEGLRNGRTVHRNHRRLGAP